MSRTLEHLFNLRRDQDDPDVIDADIRAGSDPVGANLWVLFFAILIASVGLNVNSTAVIIGAMLVSPLMGPIQAMGYGAAVQDLALIRQGARTLAIFTGVSLVTSTLYFAVSPLTHPGTELLARTTPNLWDVLIAAFGGAAGMVAATRKDVSTVIPGVAIATALMPPLCTVGFGLANGRWNMVAGAMYLFLINGMFIAFATLLVTRMLALPLRGSVEPRTRARHRLGIALGIVVVLAPSVWLAYRFVGNEVFEAAAERVARQLQADPRVSIVAQQVDAPARLLRLTLVGKVDEARVMATAKQLMASEGQSGSHIELRRAGDEPVDLNSLRSQIKRDLDQSVVQQLQLTEARLLQVEGRLTTLVEQSAAAPPLLTSTLLAEVRAQLPQVSALTLAWGERTDSSAMPSSPPVPGTAASAPSQPAPPLRQPASQAVVLVEADRLLRPDQRDALLRWLEVRLGGAQVQLIDRVVLRGEPKR